MVKVVVKLGQLLRTVLAVQQQLAVGEFAGVGKDADVFAAPGEEEEGGRHVVVEHRLDKPVEKQFIFGLQQ